MALPEYQPILPPSNSSVTLVTEERSGAPESYIMDECVTPKPSKRNSDDFTRPRTKRRMVQDNDNLSSVGTSVFQRANNKRPASEASSEILLPSLTGSKKEKVLITGEMLSTIQNRARMLLGDRELHELDESDRQDLLNLQSEYQKMHEMFVQQEKGMQLFIQELNKSRPMSEYEMHVMDYDFFSKKSTFRTFHVIDVLLGRQ